MSESTPNCCKNCEVLGSKPFCHNYSKCPCWLAWFHKEWSQIREAADRIRENNKKGGPKR